VRTKNLFKLKCICKDSISWPRLNASEFCLEFAEIFNCVGLEISIIISLIALNSPLKNNFTNMEANIDYAHEGFRYMVTTCLPSKWDTLIKAICTVH
jgi:hypothetical protein